MTELEKAQLEEAVSLAREHVGIKGHKIHAFLETLRMCGWAAIRRKHDRESDPVPR